MFVSPLTYLTCPALHPLIFLSLSFSFTRSETIAVVILGKGLVLYFKPLMARILVLLFLWCCNALKIYVVTLKDFRKRSGNLLWFELS